MDAIQLLKEDHVDIKHLLTEGDGTTTRAVKTREGLLETLKQKLTTHETVEEEIFYPALKEHAEAKAMVLESLEEHDVVDGIMGELQSTPVDDETWAAKFTVMKENLEHHIEEEEGTMFNTARDLFEETTLEDLGQRMQARREELARS